MKAEARKIKITSESTNEEIFNEMISAFHLPYSSIEECSDDPKEMMLINALLSTIRYESEEAEKYKHTADNLEVQTAGKDKVIKNLRKERDSLSLKLQENQNSTMELMKQYQAKKEEADQFKKENKVLLNQNRHITEEFTKLKKLHFGVKSEKMDDVLDDDDNEDPLNENEENDIHDTGDNHTGKGSKDDHKKRGTRSSKKKGNGKKGKGKRARDCSKLPQQILYEYDIEELDRKYGKGNWRFAFWKEHKTFETTHVVTYVKIVYTPKISAGLDHHMITIPFEDEFVQHSPYGRSLVASWMCDKYGSYIPAYRMEQDVSRYGCRFSRATITNRMNDCALHFFMPVYNRMQKRLAGYRWQQCDETTWLIIKDGRKAGRKSYYWVHRSSEKDHEDPPIILFQIELSRSEEHLEKFFTDQIIHGDLKIYLESDAYSAYKMLARLYPEIFTCCFCLTHCRRRFVDALDILKKANKSGDDLTKSDEWLIVDLFRQIYEEEGKLDNLTAEERLIERQKTITPLMFKLFTKIKSLKPDDSSLHYSDTMKDAVAYALDNEEGLHQFLTDGNIPIDDNGCERCVKNAAILRKNSLFSYSINGAVASGITLTMVRTAIVNGADPYYYLLYLLTYMPKKYYGGTADQEDLENMMPWSPEYKKFEAEEKEKAASLFILPGNEKPKTPRKKNSTKKANHLANYNHTNSVISKNFLPRSLRSTRSILVQPMCI